VEWLKVKALSSSPSTTKKKKRKKERTHNIKESGSTFFGLGLGIALMFES
jgi:hypothetical protein